MAEGLFHFSTRTTKQPVRNWLKQARDLMNTAKDRLKTRKQLDSLLVACKNKTQRKTTPFVSFAKNTSTGKKGGTDRVQFFYTCEIKHRFFRSLVVFRMDHDKDDE